MNRLLRHGLLISGACLLPQAQAWEWHGLLDIRALHASSSEDSWTHAGLGKLRYDANSDGLRLGQAMLKLEGDVSHSVSATMVLNAADDRPGLLNINEAWLGWSPVPSGPWKLRAKAGAFFPAGNVEIDYDSVGWTPERTLSSSAINSWIGEEFRTKGLELNASHLGRFEGSPHSFGFNAALFNGNDAAGTLMAWRGWSVSDRITGLSEAIELPDLEVYENYGEIPRQSRQIHLFREIDHRLGYYLGASYQYAHQIDIMGMHYDNRGDPLMVKDGQYSWHTQFDQISARWQTQHGWEFLLQALNGSTLMGPKAVYLDYWSWYGLASHPLGTGQITLRFDQFATHDHDILPQDPNSERGYAIALAYAYPITPALHWVSEGLRVNSHRAARNMLGSATQQTELSLTTALQWRF